MSKKAPTVLYVIGSYPMLTTTFIDREIAGLRDRGLRIRILSLRKNPAFSNLSPRRQALASSVCFLLPPRLKTMLGAMIISGIRRPITLLSLVFGLVRGTHPHWKARVMTVVHVLEGLYAHHTLRREEFDHVHAHFFDRAATVALVVSRFRDCSFSATAHANDIFRRPVLLPEKISRARFVVTVSDYNRDHLRSLLPEGGRSEILVLHPWVDLAEFATREEAPPHAILQILSVGRLVEKKGHRILIDACSLLRDRGLEFVCHIIGAGILHPELSLQIREARLETMVHLLGPLPQSKVREMLAQCHIFALPCVVAQDGDRDGIPVALAEAMACRRPVISTRVAGIPELVRPQAGLLVPPGDAGALADAVMSLWQDPDLRRTLGQGGRQVVEDSFELSPGVARLARAFEEAVGA